MAGSQIIIILGTLGQDPQVSQAGSGTTICKFSLATSKKIKGEDVTSWHRCTAFGKTGEVIGQYVAKGQQLQIFGELSYGSYEKNGVTMYTTDVIVNTFTFVASKKQEQNQGFQNNQQNGFQGGQ